MTLPGFDYPDQSAWGWAPGVWQEQTAERILKTTTWFPSWGPAMGEWGDSSTSDTQDCD